jgi:hypothetical protein
MRTMTLGKTGLTVSEVGFGCIPIIRLSQAEAVAVLQRAFERGITFYDTARMYLDSEEKIGKALGRVREHVVLATKTTQREGKAALAELETSLRLLGTDWIDLYQLHQLSKPEELETALGPGGVLEALRKAKEQGKIRHIGFTSHSLEMARKLVATGLFETVQFPFNLVETEAGTTLHPEARTRDMGILVMKPFAGGILDDGGLCLRYIRQFPDLMVLPGLDSLEYVDEIADLYEDEREFSAADEARAEAFRAELGSRFCRRCGYCQPCPNGVSITNAMMYGVLAKRLSPAKAVKFARESMESVRQCIACGECLDRCPYGLPIPDMLTELLEMYERHCNECLA